MRSPLDFKRLFEQGPVSWVVLDPDLVIVAASDAYLRDTMTKRADIIGQPVFGVFPGNPGDRQAGAPSSVRDALDRVRRDLVTETLAVDRYDLERPESAGGGYEVRYWSTVLTPMLGPGQGLDCIVARVEDVTDYVQAAKSLHQADGLRRPARREEADFLARSAGLAEANRVIRRSAALFEKVLDAAPDGMLGVDASGTIWMVNRQIEALFGYQSEELIGSPVETLLPERSSGIHVTRRKEYAASPRTRPMGIGLDLAGRRKDGTEFPVNVSLSNLDDEDNLLVIAAIRDVTDQVAASAVARRLAAIVECADDAIYHMSVDGVLTSWNSGAEQLLGYTAEEIVGKPVTVLATPGHENEDARLIRQVVSTGQVTRADTVRVRKDGTLIDVSVVLSLVHDQVGQVTGIATIARDITERRRAEEALTEQRRQLEASNAELLQFAYVASHDLQEPLRKVTSFCQLLARHYRGQLDERADEYIGYVVDGATRMQQLINDLLTLSRVGRQAEEAGSVDCSQVVRGVLRDLGPTLEETGAQVAVTGTLPVVRGHPTLLAQLFGNIVANAIKFHGTEPPRVEISAACEDGAWRFAVTDNGIGIEPQYADRIFELFQRLHSRAEYPGTGIGLSVCKKVVESYGGRIWFDSRPGAGTTFYWTIPVKESRP